MLKQGIKAATRKRAIEDVKRMTQCAEQIRSQREKEYERKVEKENNSVITFLYPPLVDYYSVAGYFLIGLLIFMLEAMGGICIYMFGYSIHELGFSETIKDLRELGQEFTWNVALAFVIFILFFAGMMKFCIEIGKYYENTVCIFTEKYVHIKNYFRKDKFVSYDEIGEFIKKRKIAIKNGGMQIPYKGGKIHVTATDPGLNISISMLLQKKYGVGLPKHQRKPRYSKYRHWFLDDKFNAAVRRTGIGESMIKSCGGILIGTGIIITLIIFFSEGKFTWEHFCFDFLNPMTLLGLCFVEIGLIINMILYFPTVSFFRTYKKHIKVPISTFLYSLLLVGIVWSMLVAGYDNIKHPDKLAEKKVKDDVAEEFCRDVFHKEYEDVTQEELDSVKYFYLNYTGTGMQGMEYSFHDYREFATEEEFEETILSWEKDMGGCNADYPINFTMFKGLKRIDMSRCYTTHFLFSEEAAIEYIDAWYTPAQLLEIFNPENVKVLHCESKDVSDQYLEGIENYSQLEEFSYFNTETFFKETDVSNLGKCKSLQKIKLECGRAYTGLEALSELKDLKSVSIDNATLNECVFLKDTKQLEELEIRCGNEPDFFVLTQLPKLKTVYFWDYQKLIDLEKNPDWYSEREKIKEHECEYCN